jgi:presenilin-like A22 family membrane protease
MAEPAAPAAGEAEASDDGAPSVDAADLRAATAMGVAFVGSIVLAMLMADTLQASLEPVVQDPEDPTNPLLYLGMVVVFTLALLLVARLGLQGVIQAVVLGAVFFLMAFLFEPLLGAVGLLPGGTVGGFPLSRVVSGGLAAVLTVLLYVYPEWYVVDAVGVSVAAGAAGWFGFSFGLVPALILLVAFAVYDAIAVYRTEHMIDLADEVMGLRLPILLVVPKTLDYSFLEDDQGIDDGDDEAAEDGSEEPADPDEVDPAAGDEDQAGDAQGEEETAHPGDRDALFMGLGDIVIPGVLVVSALVFLADQETTREAVLGLAPNVFVSLATLAGATVGFVVLMRGVLKGSPHAGLPALNGGALVGFLAPTVWLYGVGPLIPAF